MYTEKQWNRFWRKVDKDGPTMPHMETSCWQWTASIDTHGYGHVKLNGKIRLAHRLVMGEPKGKQVTHECDNKACVNPAHLTVACGSKNMKDVARRHPTRYTLKPEQIHEIREYLKQGCLQKDIAAFMGIGQAQVSRINTGALWDHV